MVNMHSLWNVRKQLNPVKRLFRKIETFCERTSIHARDYRDQTRVESSTIISEPSPTRDRSRVKLQWDWIF